MLLCLGVWGSCQKVLSLDCMGVLYLRFCEISILLPIKDEPEDISTYREWGFLHCIPPTLVISNLLNICHSYLCEIICDNEHFFLYFIIIHQSLRKCWFISSPHFWMRLLDFVYVVKSFWVAYNIYYLSLICCIVCKYFLLFRRVIKILILA